MARDKSQLVSNHKTTKRDVPSLDALRTEEMRTPKLLDTASLGNEDGLFPEMSDMAHDTTRNIHNHVNKDDNCNGGHVGVVSHQDTMMIQSVDNDEVGSLTDFCNKVNPLKAQLPPCNLFSRKEMSRFLKSKKISPPTCVNYHNRKLETPQRENSNELLQRSEIIVASPELRLTETRSTNGSATWNNLTLKSQSPPDTNGTYLSDKYYPSSGLPLNGHRYPMSTIDAPIELSKELNKTVTSITEGKKSNSEVAVGSDGDGLGMIEGNMCASATGVVRVQSRKKAEMFLVRTDGFSCAREKVTESSLAFTHPSTQQQMLMWKSTPKTVLLLKKLGQELMEEAKEVASFLYHQEKMCVLVEPDVHDIFARIPGFGFVQTFYSQDTSDLHERVDFVACLGGDGVILHASNLFRGAVPPVVSFNLGSLGFLTSHNFEDFRQDLKQVICGNNTMDGVYITLRMRLRCEIYRNGKAMPGKVFDVLNEVVVDRGSNPYISKIECFEHDRLITKVQGDGVIVATPTGSTAYSTSAGGSMVHPNVPCMLFTPICPHSLSFRPVILPDSARLELKIPEDARSNAWVSFDGKRRQQLSRGDSVRIFMSQHPLPTVNKADQTGDWFRSLIRCLNWNERLDQKAL